MRIERYHTPEQVDRLAERQAGTDPADRWNSLIEQFTGGGAGIRASLQKLSRQRRSSSANPSSSSP